MDTEVFERIKRVLKKDGWLYYDNTDLWTTKKDRGGIVFTNEVLIKMLDVDDFGIIGFFFTFVLNKPDILKEVFGVLPKSYFDNSYEICC